MATATLADHLAEYRRLIHDPNDVLVMIGDKIANVNAAIKRRDLVTGGNRTTVTYTLTLGTNLYTFTQLGNTNVFDVVSITILFNGLRVVLDEWSNTKLLTTYLRQTTYRDVPRAYARYGASQVKLGPIPSLAYVSEWDCCQYTGTPLTVLTDTDPLPYPYTESVPYWAARLGMINAQRYDEAQKFEDDFYTACSLIEGARTGFMPHAYATAR